MANASSRARAVYKQNTAVLYVDRSEGREVPVSTARVVTVGAANAARSGATLQLVASEAGAPRVDAPAQVVQVEPPRAAARQRPARPTRVIAYNVRIVAQEDAPVGDEAFAEAPAMPYAPTAEQYLEQPQHARRHADDARFVVPGRSAREAGADHYAMPPRGRGHTDAAQFVVPGRSAREAGADHYAQPNRTGMPHGEQYELHNAPRAPYDARFDAPNATAMPLPMPEGQRGPLAGSIPLSMFGALENMGGRLHERTRRAAARAHAAALDGSHKQLWNEGRGSLLSNRNLCIAVAAYAMILFLLAAFTG